MGEQLLVLIRDTHMPQNTPFGRDAKKLSEFLFEEDSEIEAAEGQEDDSDRVEAPATEGQGVIELRQVDI